MRFAALLAAALLVTSGCASTRGQRTTLVVSGAVVTAIGVGLFVSMQQDDEPLVGSDGPTEGDLGCLIGGCVIAGTLTAAGLGLLIGGLASTISEPTSAPPPALALAPAPMIETAPAIETAPTIAAPPVLPALAAPMPLPAIDTDAETLRYAHTVSLAIGQQQCPLARTILREIARRDPRYYQALAASPRVASCQ